MVAHIRVSNLAEKVRQHEQSTQGRFDSARRKVESQFGEVRKQIGDNSRHAHEHLRSICRRGKNTNDKTLYLYEALVSLADKLGYKVAPEEVVEDIDPNKLLEEVKDSLPPFFKKLMSEGAIIPMSSVPVKKKREGVAPLVVTKKPAPRNRTAPAKRKRTRYSHDD